MKIRVLTLLIVGVSIISCRPTSVLQQAKTKFYKGSEMNKVAVIAFPGQLLDVASFEDAMVKRTKLKGIDVIAGYKIYQDKEEIPADAISIREDLRKQGYSGVIEMKLVSIRNVETSTETDYPTNREFRIMDVANYGKLVQEYSKREEKGATFEDVKVKMDVRLVDLLQDEAQVIWSARTETVNPRDAKNVAVGVSKKTSKVMLKEKVFEN